MIEPTKTSPKNQPAVALARPPKTDNTIIKTIPYSTEINAQTNNRLPDFRCIPIFFDLNFLDSCYGAKSINKMPVII